MKAAVIHDSMSAIVFTVWAISKIISNR